MNERLRELSESVCEAFWCVLPPGHEEHPPRGVAIMSAECRVILVFKQRSSETDDETRASADALCRLLNLAACGEEASDEPDPVMRTR